MTDPVQYEEFENVETFVYKNRELLVRILIHGDAESRGYALALLANGASTAGVDAVQEELRRLKEKEG